MNAMLSRLHTQPCTIAAGRRPRPVYGIIRYPVKYSVVRHLPSGRTVVAKAAASDRPTGSEAAILKLTDSLRLLETERDEAVGTAESSARSAVKLEEMTRLLERLAMDKVSEGDDAGARQVLQEKAAVAEVLSRTSSRAQTNFALAAKLAEKIGQHQADLMDLLAGGGSSSSSSGSISGKPAASSAAAAAPPPAAAAAAAAAAPQPPPASPRPASSSSSSTSSYSGYSSSSSAGSSSSYSSGGGYEAPWEKSLEQARQRIKQAEAEAAAAGSAAAWKGRESLEEARERLRRDALSSVASARSRIQASASESIEAARARIAAEDAAVLAQVHALIDRYKAGQYVSEDDLDWAFRQLEQRAWRS